MPLSSVCPLTHSFHSGPHLQADEKRQLRALPAFQFVPRPADSEKESRCHRLFGQIQAVFYSMALEMKKGQNIGKAIPFFAQQWAMAIYVMSQMLKLLLIRQTHALQTIFFPLYIPL